MSHLGAPFFGKTWPIQSSRGRFPQMVFGKKESQSKFTLNLSIDFSKTTPTNSSLIINHSSSTIHHQLSIINH